MRVAAHVDATPIADARAEAVELRTQLGTAWDAADGEAHDATLKILLRGYRDAEPNVRSTADEDVRRLRATTTFAALDPWPRQRARVVELALQRLFRMHARTDDLRSNRMPTDRWSVKPPRTRPCVVVQGLLGGTAIWL